MIKYRAVDDELAQQFFYVNPDTGVITVKRLLTTDSTDRYTVRIRERVKRTRDLVVKHIANIAPSYFNEIIVFLQLTIEANDQGSPPKTRNVEVRISVERDENEPEFGRIRDQEISVNFAVGETVVQASAEDRDLDESGVRKYININWFM